jgi:hypothetical protein
MHIIDYQLVARINIGAIDLIRSENPQRVQNNQRKVQSASLAVYRAMFAAS